MWVGWGGLLAVAAIVWLHPQFTVDTYMAIAGGRDVVDGKLGAPDDWAFTTDSPWLNQNWSAGLLFYGLFTTLGGAGLVALKAAAIALISVLLYRCCRRRGAGRLAALAATAAAVLGARSYLDMRPNIVALNLLVLAMLLLYRGRRRPQRAWWVAALIVLWGNTHGSFLFGAGMLGLWTLCVALIARGPRPFLLPVITLVAVVAAGILNPFGIANLTTSFGDWGAFREIAEWRPIFSEGAFGSTIEFVVLLVALAAVGGGLLLARLRRAALPGPADRAALAAAVFDAALVATAVVMTLAARRFVPFAMLTAAPVLARGLQAAASRARWLPAAALATVVAIALSDVPRLLFHYRADNPNYSQQPLFERMIVHDQFAADAAHFIADNDIAGRVLNDWWWEGFLHWHAPRLELFAGGRAQFVYTADVYRRWSAIFAGNVAPEAVAKQGAYLVVMASRSPQLLNQLFFGDGSPWIPIYADGWAWLFADASAPPGRALVERARSGGLRFPSPAIAAISRAILLCAPREQAPAETILAAARQACALQPTAAVYESLYRLAAMSSRLPAAALVGFLEAESDRLRSLDYRRSRGSDIVRCRVQIAFWLGYLHRAAKQPEAAERWLAESQRLLELLQAVQEGRQ